jgi:hypothetical protein
MNATLVATRLLLTRRNKLKTQATAIVGAGGGTSEDIAHAGAFLDMTDIENSDFRVSLFLFPSG